MHTPSLHLGFGGWKVILNSVAHHGSPVLGGYSTFSIFFSLRFWVFILQSGTTLSSFDGTQSPAVADGLTLRLLPIIRFYPACFHIRTHLLFLFSLLVSIDWLNSHLPRCSYSQFSIHLDRHQPLIACVSHEKKNPRDFVSLASFTVFLSSALNTILLLLLRPFFSILAFRLNPVLASSPSAFAFLFFRSAFLLVPFATIPYHTTHTFSLAACMYVLHP
jgi:hypothetical protein